MKFPILISFIILFLSCKSEKFKSPIEESTLVNIIADLQIVEEALQRETFQQKDSLISEYKKQIFQLHNVDSLLVENTLLKLKSQPEAFKAIYEKVVDKLKELENPENEESTEKKEESAEKNEK